jgi:hypothetical protein
MGVAAAAELGCVPDRVRFAELSDVTGKVCSVDRGVIADGGARWYVGLARSARAWISIADRR